LPVQQQKQLPGMGSTIRDMQRRITTLEARVRQTSMVCVSAGNVASTTTTSWTVFPTGGTFPQTNSEITVQIGSSGSCVISFGGAIYPPSNAYGLIGVAINGTVWDDVEVNGASSALQLSAWTAAVVTEMNPGDNIFQLQYTTSGPGTGVGFYNPLLIVQPL
jgi:hypothetical protein